MKKKKTKLLQFGWRDLEICCRKIPSTLRCEIQLVRKTFMNRMPNVSKHSVCRPRQEPLYTMHASFRQDVKYTIQPDTFHRCV